MQIDSAHSSFITGPSEGMAREGAWHMQDRSERSCTRRHLPLPSDGISVPLTLSAPSSAGQKEETWLFWEEKQEEARRGKAWALLMGPASFACVEQQPWAWPVIPWDKSSVSDMEKYKKQASRGWSCPSYISFVQKFKSFHLCVWFLLNLVILLQCSWWGDLTLDCIKWSLLAFLCGNKCIWCLICLFDAPLFLVWQKLLNVLFLQGICGLTNCSSHSFSVFQAEGPQSGFFLPEPFHYYFCFEMGSRNRMNNSRYILLPVILDVFASAADELWAHVFGCLPLHRFGQNWHVSNVRAFRGLHLGIVQIELDSVVRIMEIPQKSVVLLPMQSPEFIWEKSSSFWQKHAQHFFSVLETWMLWEGWVAASLSSW